MPLIADDVNIYNILYPEIHKADDRVVESYNHQGSDGEVGNDVRLDTIQ